MFSVTTRGSAKMSPRGMSRKTSFGEERLEFRVDKVDILGIGAGTARKVTPDRRHRYKFRIRHVVDLKPAVFRRKVEVRLTWHDVGFRLDRPQSRLEVALVELVVADIAVLPGPEHRQQVVGVLWKEKAFPERNEEILKRGIAHDLQIKPLAIKGLRKAPAGIDACGGAQAARWLLVVPAFLPGCVRRQRGLHALEENKIMARTFGRTAERRDQIHHIGVKRTPMESLQRAHRPAGNQANVLDAELLRHQTMLGADIVVGRHLRKSRSVVRFGHVAWRRGQAVAEHIRDDDEVLLWIECPALANQPLVVVVLAGVPRRIDDDVVLGGVKRPKGLVGQLAVAERQAALQLDGTKIIDLIIETHDDSPLCWITDGTGPAVKAKSRSTPVRTSPAPCACSWISR